VQDEVSIWKQFQGAVHMLLKSADNKERQIAILKNLLNHDKILANKKQQIDKELRNLAIGIATEKQAAYEIDFYFGHSKNLIVLHDLRLEINGRVAQIDHLIMNRSFEVFVLETKTFNSGLSINDRGEFSTFYDNREIGIPSPIAQNSRHITVLRDAFNAVGLPTRLGVTIQPSFHPVVLVSPKAVINRPASNKIDPKTIIKLDQFSSWYNARLDETNVSDLVGIFKICSLNTIKELGEKLVGLHQPGRVDYIRKFDLTESLLSKETVAPPVTGSFQYPQISQNGVKESSHYFCAGCQKTIAEVVAKFCWNNKLRFSGKAYCRTCQGKF
jgi:predicted RNA binding protein with dsRBD fold (UPF0201 family)